MTDILFLGTGAGIPSRSRSLPCVAVRSGSEIVLFDCGEGAQRQMMASPMSFMKISGIFITHFHGDHLLGLPGLLQTMGMSGRKKEVIIGGPKGIADSVRHLLAACERTYTEKDPTDPTKELEFPLKIVEMERTTVNFDGYRVESFVTEHGVTSIGFKFTENDRPGKFDKDKAIALGLKEGRDFSLIQEGKTVNGVSPEMIIGPGEPGRSIVYSGDTAPCDGLSEAAEGAHVLIHESTYAEGETELARNYMHSTCMDAAKLASEANVKALLLTHMSNRYDDLELLRKEAMRVFENTMLAHDMDMFQLTKSGIRLT